MLDDNDLGVILTRNQVPMEILGGMHLAILSFNAFKCLLSQFPVNNENFLPMKERQ